jgi:hypothetical protein
MLIIWCPVGQTQYFVKKEKAKMSKEDRWKFECFLAGCLYKKNHGIGRGFSRFYSGWLYIFELMKSTLMAD